jgi:hypothetical protein
MYAAGSHQRCNARPFHPWLKIHKNFTLDVLMVNRVKSVPHTYVVFFVLWHSLSGQKVNVICCLCCASNYGENPKITSVTAAFALRIQAKTDIALSMPKFFLLYGLYHMGKSYPSLHHLQICRIWRHTILQKVKNMEHQLQMTTVQILKINNLHLTDQVKLMLLQIMFQKMKKSK